MIGRLLPPPDIPVHAGGESSGGGGVEEEMINPEPGVSSPGTPHLLPEGVDAVGRVQLPDGASPSLGEQLPISFPGLRSEQGVVHPALRPLHVELLWDDVEVAGQDDRLRLRHELLGTDQEAVKPAE